MEALQCIKCAIRHDLLFKEHTPSLISEVEEEPEDVGVSGDLKDVDGSDVEMWEGLLIEDEDEDDEGEKMYWSE